MSKKTGNVFVDHPAVKEARLLAAEKLGLNDSDFMRVATREMIDKIDPNILKEVEKKYPGAVLNKGYIPKR